MDKYEQIGKLAEAAALIQEVLFHADPDFADALQDMVNSIANIADAIEEAE